MNVVAVASSWAALLAALLSIGVEIYRARKPRPMSVIDEPDEDTFYVDRWRLTRGVTVLSAIPILALMLAINAIGLYADLFFWDVPVGDRKEPLPETLVQLHSVQIGSFIRTVQAVFVAVLVFLIARFVLYYIVRVGETWDRAESR